VGLVEVAGLAELDVAGADLALVEAGFTVDVGLVSLFTVGLVVSLFTDTDGAKELFNILLRGGLVSFGHG